MQPAALPTRADGMQPAALLTRAVDMQPAALLTSADDMQPAAPTHQDTSDELPEGQDALDNWNLKALANAYVAVESWGRSPVSALNELGVRVRYTLVEQSGPAHCPSFIVVVTVADMRSEGRGHSKREARDAAARACLVALLTSADGMQPAALLTRADGMQPAALLTRAADARGRHAAGSAADARGRHSAGGPAALLTRADIIQPAALLKRADDMQPAALLTRADGMQPAALLKRADDMQPAALLTRADGMQPAALLMRADGMQPAALLTRAVDMQPAALLTSADDMQPAAPTHQDTSDELPEGQDALDNWNLKALANAYVAVESWGRSPVSALNELGVRVRYTLVEQSGPAHCPSFTVVVTVADMRSEGRGHSKREARDAAARACLVALLTRADDIQPAALLTRADGNQPAALLRRAYAMQPAALLTRADIMQPAALLKRADDMQPAALLTRADNMQPAALLTRADGMQPAALLKRADDMQPAALLTRADGMQPAALLTRADGMQPVALLTRKDGIQPAALLTRADGMQPAALLTSADGMQPAALLTSADGMQPPALLTSADGMQPAAPTHQDTSDKPPEGQDALDNWNLKALANAYVAVESWGRSPVSALNELGVRVRYTLVEQSGPAHCPSFTVVVTVADMRSEGRGHSKREARDAAARACLVALLTRADGMQPAGMQPAALLTRTDDMQPAALLTRADGNQPAALLTRADGMQPAALLKQADDMQPAAMLTRADDMQLAAPTHQDTSDELPEGQDALDLDSSSPLLQDNWNLKALANAYVAVESWGRSPVSALNELSVRVRYTLVEQTGPAHCPSFTVVVTVADMRSEGRGHRKREARDAAARACLVALLTSANGMQPAALLTCADGIQPAALLTRADGMQPAALLTRADDMQPAALLTRADGMQPAALLMRADGMQPAASTHQDTSDEPPEGQDALDNWNLKALANAYVAVESWGRSPVSALNELGVRVRYTLVEQSGTAHCPSFTVVVTVADMRSEGRGHSKREARDAAARACLVALLTRADGMQPAGAYSRRRC
ncbi:unnamed protein product [Parnassius apollo]|uniref:(apollo) hypothetical protein n=1 Tax=Parnassius apollo TaxID=110799 RepID=A0A8S3YC14_PARAO|nr:unnamed protein product [Parnassius apollo]